MQAKLKLDLKEQTLAQSCVCLKVECITHTTTNQMLHESDTQALSSWWSILTTDAASLLSSDFESDVSMSNLSN